MPTKQMKPVPYDLITVSDNGNFSRKFGCRLPGKWKIYHHLYGVVIESESRENSFTVMWSPGQGGSTAWAVMHVSVDMGLDIVRGICKWDNLEKAINGAFIKLTKGWTALK